MAKRWINSRKQGATMNMITAFPGRILKIPDEKFSSFIMLHLETSAKSLF